jgi:hypothetical protein
MTPSETWRAGASVPGPGRTSPALRVPLPPGLWCVEEASVSPGLGSQRGLPCF